MFYQHVNTDLCDLVQNDFNLFDYFVREHLDIDLDDDDTPKVYIEQSHYGDFLVEKWTSDDDERFRVWLNHPDNGLAIEIEYCGAHNDYKWESIAVYDYYNGNKIA